MSSFFLYGSQLSHDTAQPIKSFSTGKTAYWVDVMQNRKLRVEGVYLKNFLVLYYY